MAESRPRIPKLMAMPAPSELRRMPLTPLDGFVLSRVDGSTSEEGIVLVTGVGLDDVRGSLERLATYGLVSLGDDAVRPVSGTMQTQKTPTLTDDRSEPPPLAANSTPSPTGSGTNLTPEERSRIEELFGKLDALDHYALLGVPRTGDKKEIKRAYYERAALFHPDRYFRRNVGPVKGMLETIFGHITRAHDVLTDKVQRAEYDAYLATVARTHELEERLEQGEAKVRDAQRLTDEFAIPSIPVPAAPAATSLRSSASAPEATPSDGPPSGRDRAVAVTVAVTSPRPASTPVGPTPTAPRTTAASPSARPGEARRPSRPIVPIDTRARRDLLAKHLIGGRPTPSMAPPQQPQPPQPPGASTDPDGLRRHFDQKKNDVARAQSSRHKQAGDQAFSAGDLIAAASSYKAALSFAPDDLELQRLHKEAQTASTTVLGDTYRKQALYEEKSDRWADAAKSWRKLAELRPTDVQAQHGAGNALLRANTDNLHDAAAYAQRAVALEPRNAEHRKLLASIYLEAGLLKNARREIDAALQLLPGDDSIAALAKRLANAMGR